MVYMDGELATGFKVISDGMLRIERALGKVTRSDLEKTDDRGCQNMTLGPVVMLSSGEPYAVLYMEDVWVAGEMVTSTNREVIERATDMLINPQKYNVDGSLV